MQEFELIAKTFMGLEQVLAKELTDLGANNVQIGRRMVAFTGNKETMYRANFQLHTAIRILKPIAHFKARSAEDMYDEVRKIDWSQYIQEGKTFSVDSVVYSEEFTNSRFVTYKVKDAIVDQFRERTGTRHHGASERRRCPASNHPKGRFNGYGRANRDRTLKPVQLGGQSAGW